MALMSRITVQFIVPPVEQYRAPFYALLSASPQYAVTICCNMKSEGDTLADYTHGHDFRLSLFPPAVHVGRLKWHTGISVLEGMGRGDVLVVSGDPGYLSTYRHICEAKSRGIRVICWSIGIMPGQVAWRFTLRRALMSPADALMLYTDSEVERYADRGYDPGRLFATNNTIDQTDIRAATAHWQRDACQHLTLFRHSKHIRDDQQILLYCGRLQRKARLDLLVRAMRVLKESGVRPLCVCIGAGPEKRPLLELASRNGVSECFRWLGPIFNQVELAPWFLMASAYVYPGAIGLGMHHAFGYGLPVITHGERDLQTAEYDALTPNVNGLVFRNGDYHDLATVLRRHLGDPDGRARMKRAALDTVSRAYTIESMVSRFHNALRAVSELPPGAIGLR